MSTQPSNLGSLCILDLRDNRLEYLPEELGQLQFVSEYDYGDCILSIDGNPFISPPKEVLTDGTAAILAYLRNETWWHLQRFILSGASAIGLVAAIILGFRWRNNRGKQKRKPNNH